MLIKLNPITAGKVSSTGTVRTRAQNLGAVVITADGTNDATVVIRDNTSGGTILVDVVTKTPGQIFGPFSAPSGQIYYSITGTGASAQLYEYEAKGF